MQLKRTVAQMIGGLWGDEAQGDEDDVLVARVADFDYPALGMKRVATMRNIPVHLQADRRLVPGDLLLEKSGGGDTQNVGRVVRWVSGDRAVSSNFINVLRCEKGYESRFLSYVHRSLYNSGHAAACTKQTTGIQNLDVSAYLSAEIDIPGFAEQTQIADFLDRECDRIGILGEELGAASALATTAHVDGLRRLIVRDEVDQVPLKFYAQTGTGHTPSREHPEYWIPAECLIPWFTLADIRQIREGRVIEVTETSERVSEVGLANSSAVKLPAGTVILSRTASVGFSAIIGVDMAVSQDFMTWTCGPRLEPRYLLLTLRAMQPDLRRLMYGSTHKTIYMPDLHALRVPLPDRQVQRNIIERASRIAASTWPLVDEIEATQQALDDYRDALITEAVSGQLDVTRLSGAQMEESLAAAREAQRPEVLAT
jgi:type I restriction enzyme S subunit